MLAVKTLGLSKDYGKYPGINNVNLSVNAGEIFGLIGPRGCGKTTVLKLLMNYIFPSEGQANVFGFDVVTDSSALKKTVCYIPTDPFYPRMKAKKVIEIAAKAHQIYDRDNIEELMSYFEVDNIKMDDMSASEKKMVAFVSAFACDPDLILIDDFTRNLDSSMHNRLCDLLQQRNQEGMTILLTNAEIGEVQDICTDYAFMENGTINSDIEVNFGDLYKKVIRLKAKGFHREEFQALGADILYETPNSIRIAYDGDLAALARLIGTFEEVQDIDINNMDLQERFMALYDHRESDETEHVEDHGESDETKHVEDHGESDEAEHAEDHIEEVEVDDANKYVEEEPADEDL